ncbi:MAG TPA: vanadium-dependent haloperoxidase [Candidatus Binatia bacterium]|nr:vanadium-dependent haloperoxidase [Candidatus Binatia bacterium]
MEQRTVDIQFDLLRRLLLLTTCLVLTSGLIGCGSSDNAPLTPTATASVSSVSPVETATSLASSTPTTAPSFTRTATTTATAKPSDTATMTVTQSPTPTSTALATATTTASVSATPSTTSTATATATATVTDTATATTTTSGTATPPATITTTPKPQSVARQWDEEILGAIRIDLPRPPIHARNLFHLSIAMWDAWAAYDPTANGYLTTEKHASADPEADRAEAISYAAFGVLSERYRPFLSVGGATALASFTARMMALGYDPTITTTTGDTPAAVGNRIAQAVINYGLSDGANEASNYKDPTYSPINPPLIVALPGATMVDPNRWQPLALSHQVSQNGIPIPGNVQVYVAPQWGSVSSFAANLNTLLPPPPPRLHDPVSDSAFKQAAVDLIQASSQLSPDDGVMIDISPAALGNNPLGTNDGGGYEVNPATGQPYTPEIVKQADFKRVIAEFWADGPNSETPPGHWNVIANNVADTPGFDKRIGGVGPIVNDLEWDVKVYLAVNAAVHDAAVGCWGTKRIYDSTRPISMIRYMGELGQSSDANGPSYDPDGLPLVPGLIEVITAESSAPRGPHEDLAAYVGEIAILTWPGGPADPTAEYSGVQWIRAKTWVPYQKDTFVTPAFAAFTSGHSTFSRAAAEVLAHITGSPYFPGGRGGFFAPKDHFLKFELGPSSDIDMQWATYYDAADQAGQSRIAGGIHILADDFNGRIMGSIIGDNVYGKARTYFDGTALSGILTPTPAPTSTPTPSPTPTPTL